MRPELRWLVMTIVIVGVLLAISALALNRPDVIWATDGPHCPACRADIAPFAHRCRECGSDFDWTVAPDDMSPISKQSLSRLEAQELRDHIKHLGVDAVVKLLSESFKWSEQAARSYVEAVGRGRCGYCGGTGEDLEDPSGKRECPICFGERNGIASGGDGHSTWGDLAAARDYEIYLAEAGAISPKLPQDVRMHEHERLARAFLAAHVGTVEAARLPDWRELAKGFPLPGTTDPARGTPAQLAAYVGRMRLDRILTLLRNADQP